MADRPRVSDIYIDGSNGRLYMQAHGNKIDSISLIHLDGLVGGIDLLYD